MRFFQGARKGEINPPEFVTSSFLQPTISATIPSKFLPLNNTVALDTVVLDTVVLDTIN